jgi:hypothetical protein
MRTASASAIFVMSSCLPLKAKADVRAITQPWNLRERIYDLFR